MDKMKRLDVIEQVLGCTNCTLHADCNGPVAFSGPAPAYVAMIGEAPGAQEDKDGAPFVGPSGQLLRSVLTDVGLDPAEVAFINTVSCFPHATPTHEHIEACRPNKIAQLKLVKPTYALLLGKVAAKGVCSKIEIKHGRRRPFEMDGIIYMAAYHPAAALRDAKVDLEFRADVQAFAELVFGEGNWMDLIPNGCSGCKSEAIWWSRSGLGWCEIHLPDVERKLYEERMKLIADDYAEARRRLGDTASAVWRQTMDDAKAAKMAGIAAADAGADGEWKAEALLAVKWCAQTYTVFTADEVWARLDAVGTATTHEPAALGPVFLEAARKQWISNTRETRPTVYTRRHRDLTVWESLIKEEVSV